MIPFTLNIKSYSENGNFNIEYTPSDSRCSVIETNTVLDVSKFTPDQVIDILKLSSPQPQWALELASATTDHTPYQSLVNINYSAGANYNKTTITLPKAKQNKCAEIAEWRYARETGGISIGGSRINTDRESQAQLTGAYISLVNHITESVNWKTALGVFVTLTLDQVTPIVEAVVNHVQSCFSAEKVLVDQVNAATTIDEVVAVVVPALTIPIATV